ncbi:hypothetical protein NE237_015889 [Protea cynaroides]|uniref:Uncharacterized protein n=1 Tax=Protea cynaroides TaxID=273540 RepID=A0A9Q0KEN2_9MAGN|nr:hypothetical protein NE237_015889 [Protea cynaroides]
MDSESLGCASVNPLPSCLEKLPTPHFRTRKLDAEDQKTAEDGNKNHVNNHSDPVEGTLVSGVSPDHNVPSDGDDQRDDGLQAALEKPRLRPGLSSGNSSPSSIGCTPYHPRVSTLPQSKPSNTRSDPKSICSIVPTAHKKFQALTPTNMESFMIPAFNQLASDCSEDDVDDEGKAVEKKVERRMRKDGYRMESEMDQAISVRVVENWEDLEVSLREILNFIHNNALAPL